MDVVRGDLESLVGVHFTAPTSAVPFVGREVAPRYLASWNMPPTRIGKRRIDDLIDVERDALGFVGAERRFAVVETLVGSACLVTMLIAPPVVPRPAKDEDGPRRISICSVKKFSRTLTAESRMPSMKMSLRASKPRMKKRSPNALPPSPVPSVTPAVREDDLLQLVAFLSSSNSLVSTVIGLWRIEDRLRKFSAKPARCRLYRELPDRRRDPDRARPGRRVRGSGAGLACAACLRARPAATRRARAVAPRSALLRRAFCARPAHRTVTGGNGVLRFRPGDRGDRDQATDRDLARRAAFDNFIRPNSSQSMNAATAALSRYPSRHPRLELLKSRSPTRTLAPVKSSLWSKTADGQTIAKQYPDIDASNYSNIKTSLDFNCLQLKTVIRQINEFQTRCASLGVASEIFGAAAPKNSSPCFKFEQLKPAARARTANRSGAHSGPSRRHGSRRSAQVQTAQVRRCDISGLIIRIGTRRLHQREQLIHRA